MNEDEFAELAAGHALRALSDVDERRYADALAAHPEWALIADEDAATAALLADAAVPAAPPAGIRDALLAQIAQTPQIGAEHEPETARPRRPRRRLFALAASVVLIVGLGIGGAVMIQQLTRPASVIALERIEAASDAKQARADLDSGAQATAHWSESLGSAVLVADGLGALDDDETYQLWLVRGDDALPAGLFDTDAGATTAMLDERVHPGDVIAVTIEQAGGSPTGLPTTDPIIAIPTA